MTANEKQFMNGENAAQTSITTAQQNQRWMTLIFPEKRELDGLFWSITTSKDDTNQEWATSSVDTTNGVDGTWVNANQLARYSDVQADFRDLIDSKAVSNVAGIMAHLGGVISDVVRHARFHVYGVISPGETPDRILFLDTENSDAVFTKVLDFAEVPRGQTQTRTFKIKNNSASLTIETIQVTAEDLYLNAGGWYEFGNDGISYQATYSVGNMANGAEETIHLKQVIPDGETLGLQTGRIKVSHADVT